MLREGLVGTKGIFKENRQLIYLTPDYRRAIFYAGQAKSSQVDEKVILTIKIPLQELLEFRLFSEKIEENFEKEVGAEHFETLEEISYGPYGQQYVFPGSLKIIKSLLISSFACWIMR